jgi:hypothetical protein
MDLGAPLLRPYPTLLETFSTIPSTDVWNFFATLLETFSTIPTTDVWNFFATLLETFSTIPSTDVWNFFAEYLFILVNKVLQFQIQFFRISTVEE